MGFTPGISKVSDLSDVVLNNPANTQVLSFDTGKWKNSNVSATSVTLAGLPAGSVIFATGANTARPSSRTDLRCLWTADSAPVNAISGDIWMNGLA